MRWLRWLGRKAATAIYVAVIIIVILYVYFYVARLFWIWSY